MQRLSVPRAAPLLALLIGLPLALAACGSQRILAQQKPLTERDFDRTHFSRPLKIDNRWFPLADGTQVVFRGRSNRGQGLLPHEETFIVTDLTKVINGVRTRVIWDADFQEGQLQEAELAFYAQDDYGNVWDFGEYAEEYERGKVVGAPNTWIVGEAGAKPGIGMRADPRPGTSSYGKGLSPKIGWGDRARVSKLGQAICVPVRCYKNVLVTDETNPLQPGDGHQFKYYAAGVGNIRTAPGTGDTEREVLELVQLEHLSRGALAQIRDKALKLDRRAYRISKDLYGHTSPAARFG